MTYCLALHTHDGLVLAADSRSSAGPDSLKLVRKLHLRSFEEREFVLLTAGNLATSQEVLAEVDRDAAVEERRDSLRNAIDLWDAASYLGRVLVAVIDRHRQALAASGTNGDSSFIIGGRIGSGPVGAMLVYPEGNAIATTPETPFLQIGESKFAKPVLDRLATAELSLEAAAQLALVSFDATIRSNATVAPPIRLAIVPPAPEAVTAVTFDEDDENWLRIRGAWEAGLDATFASLPPVPIV